VGVHPWRKLKMHGAQLARHAQRFKGEQEAAPEFVVKIGGQLVGEHRDPGPVGARHARRVMVRQLRQFAPNIGRQGAQRRRVACEQATRLYVEHEVGRRAHGPQMRGACIGHAVIRRVGLDQPELPGVMPQARLGRAHVRGIKAPAGEQGGVGPGGGAGQDGHGAGGGTAARQFRYSLYEYTVLSWLSPMSAATSDTPADDYLSDLNPAQRAAAEFGAAQADAPALLVIAGAGSGKTSTLAHRVAHLIVNGADPQRILLLTFSRRAALEMDRRVGMVLRRVMKLQPSQQAPSLPWAGTF